MATATMLAAPRTKTAGSPEYAALSSVAPTAELERWLQAAAPGETAIYATGTDLPREAEAVVLVRGWVARGVATTTMQRDPRDSGRWRFLITKSAGAGKLEIVRAHDRCDRRRMLSTLRSCAERGLPCPSLSRLADELGLAAGERGRQRAAHLMRQLEKEASIGVERRGNQRPPVVTILAPGRAHGKETAA